MGAKMSQTPGPAKRVTEITGAVAEIRFENTRTKPRKTKKRVTKQARRQNIPARAPRAFQDVENIVDIAEYA